MTLPLVLRRVAQDEYDRAADWYEQQRPGQGVAFTTAVERVFRRIAANPKQNAVVVRDIRKAVVQRYPYCVYYRERPNAVVVVSVFHTSRNPVIWQRRS